jgi:hypothetical protein
LIDAEDTLKAIAEPVGQLPDAKLQLVLAGIDAVLGR